MQSVIPASWVHSWGIIIHIDDGWLWIRLPTYRHCRINRDRDRGRFSAPAELKKGTRDQGEETMKDGSPAGR